MQSIFAHHYNVFLLLLIFTRIANVYLIFFMEVFFRLSFHLMHRWSVLWSLSCARSPLGNRQMKFCERILRQDWQSGWSYTSSGSAEQHWKMSFQSPPAASVFADLENSLEKNILILVFFWKAGFKALSDRLTTTGSRWSSCRNVNNYDWWVKMFRAELHTGWHELFHSAIRDRRKWRIWEEIILNEVKMGGRAAVNVTLGCKITFRICPNKNTIKRF